MITRVRVWFDSADATHRVEGGSSRPDSGKGSKSRGKPGRRAGREPHCISQSRHLCSALLMRCRLLLCFLLSLPLFNVSGQEPVAPQITADVFEAEFATGAAVYRGNATARYGDVVVKADELRYNVRERIIEARGHVVLTRGDTRLLAAELSYQLDSRTYRVRDLRFG